ncbi:deleted in malignant brain tumors 1 protein [Strongylocentrotus purpuratus]|uniref:SRCR domain-containing protein n=1 Tax=Strongylocentrotus purpuratus TaxID=7668 RepID=A0A7M7NAP8_STRPU|nr:deleted in malignant brain tumors 1 protein [Strongylocentrotus purpuratus]
MNWGTICNYLWDINDAHVVCRMLGFQEASEASGDSYFGGGTGSIHLSGVTCTGDEHTIFECGHAGFGISFCSSHSQDAGVVCIAEGDVRLAGGNNAAEGRVEILLEEWGTICNTRWGIDDANVVCRMLGFEEACKARPARFGEGSGLIKIDDVGCTGAENHIRDCTHSDTPYANGCDHSKDAGVVCDAPINTGALRLVGGNNAAEGRVEIQDCGDWFTICDNEWDINDATVVCRMLGFKGAAGAPRSARFGEGSGYFKIDAVGCTGAEHDILDCTHSDTPYSNGCDDPQVAGVVCIAPGSTGAVRLAGGNNAAEGRVEIQYDGVWRTICNDGWDINDANVVCRMQGFQEASGTLGESYFGQGTGPILLPYSVLFFCTGTELTIFECAYAKFGDSCNGEGAGVVCVAPAGTGAVRLVGGNNAAEGRVEIQFNGDWGTICDDDWDINDANVVCRMLGFQEASGEAYFGEGTDPIQLSRLACTGDEETIFECGHAGFGVHSCDHSKDAGVVCTAPASTGESDSSSSEESESSSSEESDSSSSEESDSSSSEESDSSSSEESAENAASAESA